MEDHLWGTAKVAAYFSISKRSAQAYLRHWKETDEGPAVELVGGRYTVLRANLQAWQIDPKRRGDVPRTRRGRRPKRNVARIQVCATPEPEPSPAPSTPPHHKLRGEDKQDPTDPPASAD